MKFKIGHGIDIHQLINNEKLLLGGVLINSNKGSIGHSDGDILLHALTDSILGALALGDIGSYFPSTDQQWKNANSKLFLEYALKKMNHNQYKVNNTDITIILQAPAITSYISSIIKNLSKIMSIDIERISVKATTTDYLGYIGKQKGIAVHVITLLSHV